MRRNQVLASLDPPDLAALAPHLVPVALPRRLTLDLANQRTTHLYFPTDGVGSIVSRGHNGKRIEVGLFGRDGMSGTAVVLGADRSPTETFMQIGGEGFRIAATEFGPILQQRPRLQVAMLRYVQVLTVQTQQTMLANAHARIDARLARWLLMCRDRVDGDDIEMTHEFLSLMLGVRRAGVTVALQAAAARGLIATARGHLTILDREGLIALAGRTYGVPEAEAARLLRAAAPPA